MSNSSDAAQHVPAGGSATVNGVLYQMLWTLLRASRARLINQTRLDDGQLQEVTLVLEPSGGGGDLVVETAGMRYVEQLKARSDGSTWSLRDVVEKVIPDLYLANLKDDSPAQYRFVTEGRMGRWGKEYSFFRSISCSPPTGDPLSDIDDTVPLWKSKQKKDDVAPTPSSTVSFWDLHSYTARQLFMQVVTEVRSRKLVLDSQTEDQTIIGLRSVLANFEFVGGQFKESVQKEIDCHLLTVVPRNDDIPAIRDALAMELARLATLGNADIDCRHIFERVGLNATPLTEWATIRRRSQRISERYLGLLGYEPLRDVRVVAAKQLLEFWPTEIPILAITGESGSGKSWRTYAICHLAQHGKSLCVIVSAGSTTDETLNRASERIWQEIVGHDKGIPLCQIAKRVQAVIGMTLNPWLTLVIDGVTERQQASDLVLQPWEDWGIRLVVSVNQRESASLLVQQKARCKVSLSENFTTRELHDYLSELLGEKWPEMPDFVRSFLKVPILADLYRQIVLDSGDRQWNPESEYDMVARFWRRAHDLEPTDSHVLVRLGEICLFEGADCWPIRKLIEAGGNNASMKRLEQAGWLRTKASIAGNVVEFVHLRLLNWVCAVALVESRLGKRSDLAKLCKDVLSFFEGSSPKHRHMLSFVPMDVIWLMCQSPNLRNEVPAVIASLEGDYRRTKFVYENLLPTIGSAVIDSLVWRLREKIDDWFVPSLITSSLGKIGGDAVVKEALALLDDKNPLLQLCGCDVLAECASSEPLDKLWKLHNECRSNPDQFLRVREKHNAHVLRDRTFPALKECCRVRPDWLIEAIGRATPSEECVADLAYLLSDIEPERGYQLWKMVKPVLFNKIVDPDQRALAVCIDTFADKDEVRWLNESLNKNHFIGTTSAKALARFEPLQTIQQLDRVPLREMIFFRASILDPLFALEPDATRRRVAELLVQNSNPWELAALYDGRSHHMDKASLDVLLAELQRQLDGLLSGPDWGDSVPLYRELQFLAQIRTTALVQHLRRQGGTPLEASLTKFILRIGRSSWDDSLNLRNAVPVLFRMGGDGFTTVVNEMLESDTGHVRLEAILLADRRPNEETFERLASIASDCQERALGYAEQCRAAVVLASHGKWAPVIDFVLALGTSALATTSDFPGIRSLPDMGFRAPSDLLQRISVVLQDCPSNATSGQVLALGFGASEAAPIVRGIATVCNPKSDLALACIVALDMLQDHSPGVLVS